VGSFNLGAAREARRNAAPRRSLKPYLAAGAFFLAAAVISTLCFLNSPAGLGAFSSAQAAAAITAPQPVLAEERSLQLAPKQARQAAGNWASAVETFRRLSAAAARPAKVDSADNLRLLRQLLAWQKAHMAE
jgi:hypothetical protein